MQIFYPDTLDTIWHRSRDGKAYRLDGIEKRVLLKRALESDPKYQLDIVSKTSAQILESAHTTEYIDALLEGKPLPLAESSGLLWLPQLEEVFSNCAQCVFSASQTALSAGYGATLASGGHHAVAERGYGFNPVNELAIAANLLLSRGLASKVAILDLDVHYANGTNTILHDNPHVLNIDIWSKTLPKWGVVADNEHLKQYYVKTVTDYWRKLELAKREILQFKPEVILYHSGMDVWEGDRMGGITGFSVEKIKQREKFVFEMTKENNIPIALVPGGGYAHHDTPEITAGSLRQLVDLHLISFQTLSETYL